MAVDAPERGTDQSLPRKKSGAQTGDRVFRSLSLSAGLLVLLIILAIAVFLILKAIPAIQQDKVNFFSSKEWNPRSGNARFGILAIAFGTLVSSALALIMGVPVALGVALFISHYAPRRLATVLGYIVDLLAAVPSIVFGLWGRDFFDGKVQLLSMYLHDHLGFIPLFGTNGTYGGSIFLGGIILAIMILPIVASLSREVFLQTPLTNEEAALALGATRWEMIRIAVLPFGTPGVLAASMLGLGRALGETIAIALVLSTSYTISWRILQPGGNTIAANIANSFAESDGTGRGALIASGLVLFAITLVVNLAARAIIYRRREFVDSAA